jgi:hypothetical protein
MIMEFFLYLREYNVIICRECRYAVLPSRLDTHLASSKHRVLRRRRVQVEQEIAAWLELLWNETDLERLRVSRGRPPAFEMLEIHLNGLRCHACSYIVCITRGIQQHCRDQHQWINPWRLGVKSADRRRANQPLDRSWTENVVCQRFFVTGPRQEYFEVQTPDRPAENDETPQIVESKWN